MQPKRQDDERDEIEEPERVPSLLSARELQARNPGAAPESDPDDSEEPERTSQKAQRKTPASANQKRSR